MWIKLRLYTQNVINASMRAIKLRIKKTLFSRNTSYIGVIPLILCCVSLGATVIGLIAGAIAHFVRKSRKSTSTDVETPVVQSSNTKELAKEQRKEIATARNENIEQSIANDIARLNTKSLQTVAKNYKS